MVDKVRDYNPLDQLLKPFYIPREVPVFFLKSFLEFIYDIEVNGVENIPKTGGAIIISNHTDLLDAPIQAVYSPRRIVFLGKEELFRPQEDVIKLLNSEISLFRLPGLNLMKPSIEKFLNLLGSMYSGQLQHWGSMPVIRNYHGNDPKSAVKYYEELEDYMISILKSGEIVSIYPEGTRTETGIMGPFKALAAKLAIRANVPIIPSGIVGAWNMSSPQAFLSGQAFQAKINYNIGNLIPPDQFPHDSQKKSAKLLTEELERRVYFLTQKTERRMKSRAFYTKL
ncbi:MAG: 1-acyl-sn-glycerol-3-phosphate acyltransferase [Leptospiraceae bacterium]|nr:1-acyl-sn-glycerol-3-phosphate acyltransferase [Leptospiraceae bacterium]